jgi:hypothetical protein
MAVPGGVQENIKKWVTDTNIWLYGMRYEF